MTFWFKVKLPHEATMELIRISNNAWKRINPGGEMILDDGNSLTNTRIDKEVWRAASEVLAEE